MWIYSTVLGFALISSEIYLQKMGYNSSYFSTSRYMQFLVDLITAYYNAK